MASESVPTLVQADDRASAPKTTELPTVAMAASPAPVPSEGLGVLCLLAGVVTALWKLASAFAALPELWDPLGFIASIRGSVPPSAVEDVALLSRAAAAATLLDSLTLMLVGAVFVVVGVVLMRRGPRGPRIALRASNAALIVVGLSVLLNLAVVLPLRGALVDQVPGLPGALPGLEALGLAVGVALVVGLSALEMGFLLAVRAWAKRLCN